MQRQITAKQCILLHKNWLKEQKAAGAVCAKCGDDGSKFYLTIDHIIPKFILQQLGVNLKVHFDPYNLQVLCKRCNIIKGCRLDIHNELTKPLLLRYIKFYL